MPSGESDNVGCISVAPALKAQGGRQAEVAGSRTQEAATRSKQTLCVCVCVWERRKRHAGERGKAIRVSRW